MTNVSSVLTIKLIDDVSSPAAKMTAAIKKAEAQVKALAAEGLSNRLGQSLTRFGASAAQIQKVGAAWREYAAASKLAANSADWTKAQAAGVRTWETATVSAIRNVMRQEDAQARQHRRLAEQAGFWARTRRAVGTAASFAGPPVLQGTKVGAKSGAEIQSERVKMRAAGIPAAEIDAAYGQSVGLAAKYPNVGISNILERYRELRSVLTDPSETPHLLETVIKANAAMNAIDRTGEMAGGLAFGIKGAEVTGRAQDPARFAAYLEAFVKGQQVMGKTITPEMQYEMAKYFRASAPTLSDRFLNTTALSLGQEMGSGGAVGVDQFIKQVVGGFQGSQHSAAKEFVALGLANKEDFETTKTGEIKGMKHGRHVAGYKLAQSDPDKWVYQYLVPALEAHGFHTLDEQIGEIRRTFPKGTAADVVAKLVQQRPSYENHAELYGKAQGFNAISGNQGDPFVALDSLGKSLSSFAGILTSPVMSTAAQVMSGLASQIGSFGEALAAFQKDHPTAATILGGGAIAGGAAGGAALTYNLLSGLMGGFGLKGSAAALDASAAALTGAAEKLAGGSLLGNAADAVRGGKSKWIGGALGGGAEMLPFVAPLAGMLWAITEGQGKPKPTTDYTFASPGGFRHGGTGMPGSGFNTDYGDEAVKQFGGKAAMAHDAGVQIGDAIRAGLLPGLQGAVDDTRKAVDAIMKTLMFDVTPMIRSPAGQAPREHLGSLRGYMQGSYSDIGIA